MRDTRSTNAADGCAPAAAGRDGFRRRISLWRSWLRADSRSRRFDFNYAGRGKISQFCGQRCDAPEILSRIQVVDLGLVTADHSVKDDVGKGAVMREL